MPFIDNSHFGENYSLPLIFLLFLFSPCSGTPGNKIDPAGPLIKYLDKVTQAILGNDAEMLKVIF